MGYTSCQRLLLFQCSFTCIYLPGIVMLLKFNDNLYNVGTYKFIPILLILIFAEGIKLSFSMLQTEPLLLDKGDFSPFSRGTSKRRKPCSKAMKEIVKFLAVSFVLSAIYYIVIVLFGAPLLTHREETTMLALTLTTLTFIPGSLQLGVDDALALLTASLAQNNNFFLGAIQTNMKATLFGSWLGAITIPLDWDKPWQAWPIPCVTGALIGYTLGHFLTLIKVLPRLKTNKKARL